MVKKAKNGISTLLIANRGEIACRIIKTAKKMGISTVAVYSDTDSTAMHVSMADSAQYIGHSNAILSYLNQEKILEAIQASGADAVHPGYGFLSENGDFVELLERNNIAFVGPSSSAIRAMADKIVAKKIANKCGVSTIPGTEKAIKDLNESLKIAKKIGYPVMIKAAAGGGGKGIRIVRSPEEMKQAIDSTQSEALNSFADSRIFIEKYIENPRHIEIQVFGDKYGNYVCLGERECSMQRKHQKVIEEAPSPFVTPKMRKEMYKQSIALAKEVKYHSAGTVEFIVNQNGDFYFMEMNTRLQVEHPVTELVTGYDLVEWMIRIANDEKLPAHQKDVKINGWAMESRIYAEDPDTGFLPSIGKITTYREPYISENIRVDTGVSEGSEISIFYDAMIAKLCTFAKTRSECIDEMKNALSKFLIGGVSHNIRFLEAIMITDEFSSGNMSTNFIDQYFTELSTRSTDINDEISSVILSGAVYAFLNEQRRVYQSMSGRSGNKAIKVAEYVGSRWIAMMNDARYPVTVNHIKDGYKIRFDTRRLYITSKWALGNQLWGCFINGKAYNMHIEYLDTGIKVSCMGKVRIVKVVTPRIAELYKYMKSDVEGDESGVVTSAIAGKINSICVKVGDIVKKGAPLVTIEAMKMENVIYSAVNGEVQEINVCVGDVVMGGSQLLSISQPNILGK